MKLLILSEDYPNNDGGHAMQYVHTRNLYYIEQGIDVTELSFSAKNDYIIDNVKVITKDTYLKQKDILNYDILICHASNLKHHYRFLNKYEKNFENIVFFFHGHEVLKISKVYSKPYKYIKKNLLKSFLGDIYDNIKLYIWRKYYTKIAFKSYYIFVSKWMYNEFIKWTKVDASIIEDRYSITYNGIGKSFEELSYEVNNKEYDFVTIRANLDGSKYSIDIVNELAKNNPKRKFLVIGKGRFFEYNKKADNLIWINNTLNHDEIIKVLNKSRCALMPTRTDAQGLMMCEMATFRNSTYYIKYFSMS